MRRRQERRCEGDGDSLMMGEEATPAILDVAIWNVSRPRLVWRVAVKSRTWMPASS